MLDSQCVEFLQWALPRLHLRWPGFRKVRKQVCKRVDRRIKELNLPDVAAYRAYLDAHPGEWAVLDAYCRITISRFYRDRSVFDCLRDEILPLLARRAGDRDDHVLDCWSAGCASGEEVYSLAVIWKLSVWPQHSDVSLHIVATDSDPQMLERARHGCYDRSSLKDFPADWLPLAFDLRDGMHCIKPEFRHSIDFQLQDLRDTMPAGPFDLVLCRHVAFTYFDEPLQRVTLAQIVNRLRPDGFLVTGKQEPLPAGSWGLVEYKPRMGIYRKSGGS